MAVIESDAWRCAVHSMPDMTITATAFDAAALLKGILAVVMTATTINANVLLRKCQP